MRTHVKFFSPLSSSLLACSLALGLAGPARAQEAPPPASASPSDEEARALHTAATLAFEQGRFDEARERFEEAYALSRLPQLLNNIAAAADRGGHEEIALARYEAYLEAVPDAPNRSFVEGRVRVLREAIARRAPAGPSASDAASEPAAGDASSADAAPPGGTPAPSSGSSGGVDYTLPGVLFGVAAATGIAAVVTGVLGLGIHDELEAACPDHVCRDASLRSRADEMQTLGVTTDVLIGVTAALAIGGVVALVLPSGSDGDASATLRVGPGGLAIDGRF